MLHEAGAVDPDSGVVYMTEDEGPDGFYRYLPKEAGDLAAGGTLQMLAVKGKPKYNTITGQTVGDVLVANWVTIDNPDPANAEDNASAVFQQGRAKGAAKFLGGEGATYRNGGVVFGSSDGGDVGSRSGLAVHADRQRREEERGGRARPAVRVDRSRRARWPGQHVHEPRRRDRDRGGREREEQLLPRLLPTAA